VKTGDFETIKREYAIPGTGVDVKIANKNL
jgi:hypothetical protein